MFQILYVSAGGLDEHAALQPAVPARELSNEILFLPWTLMATGKLVPSTTLKLLMMVGSLIMHIDITVTMVLHPNRYNIDTYHLFESSFM